MSLEIQLIIEIRRVGMPLYCACPKPEPVFTISYVDIGEIVDPTKLYIFSHYMIYCKIHVTVVCSIQMKNRKIVELSDIYLYICYFFLSHEALLRS